MALTLMSFRPRRPQTQAPGKPGHALQFAWSTIEEVQQNPPYAPKEYVVVDAETVRGTYRTRHGLSDRLDVEVEIPFLWAGAGGLDGFVEDFHDFFGLPKGGRDENEDDHYEVNVSDGGEEIYGLDSYEVGLQDIPVFLTYLVTEESPSAPAFATRIGVEFPTGSESGGFGNGAFDFGAGLLAEKSMGRWTTSGAFNFTVPGQSDRMERISGQKYDPQFGIEVGLEYRWDDHFSLIAGTVWTSRMLSSLTLEEINREVFDLGLGAIFDISDRSRFGFSVHEDLVSATGSDLTLQMGWVWGY
ncbi:MAG: hypothetical protein ACI9F9_003456 [Candidatus Paceibacteria bacterium]|jgi:hypothetical protein